MRKRINGEIIRERASTDRRWAFYYLLMLYDNGELKGDKQLLSYARELREDGHLYEYMVSKLFKRVPQYWRVILDIIRDNN